MSKLSSPSMPRPPAAPLALPRLPSVSAEQLMADPSALMASGAHLTLTQAWRSQPQKDFRPAGVWLAAAPDRFLLWAQLPDIAITTTATADHQHLWELGDIFEILLQCAASDGYFEFQIAPNGCLLQLHYPQPSLPLNLGIEQYIWREKCLEQSVERDGGSSTWRVAAVIPVRPLLGELGAGAGERWRAAFCRYDYVDERQYILSSSAPLTAPSFHRIHEWNRLVVPGGFSAVQLPAGEA